MNIDAIKKCPVYKMHTQTTRIMKLTIADAEQFISFPIYVAFSGTINLSQASYAVLASSKLHEWIKDNFDITIKNWTKIVHTVEHASESLYYFRLGATELRVVGKGFTVEDALNRLEPHKLPGFCLTYNKEWQP